MRKFLYFCISGFALISCNKLEPKNPSSGDANFSSVIAIGGNYLSGYTNGALYESGQIASVPNLIAEQMKFAEGGLFNQPLITDKNGLGLNSRPWDSDFHTRSYLGDRIDCKNETSFGPVKTLFNASETTLLNNISGIYNNFSIPYAELHQFDNVKLGEDWTSGNKNPFYSRFATKPGNSTVLSDAMDKNPTFAILWLGMEEIYNYAMRGGTGKSIPAPENTAIDSLLNALSTKKIKGVIATIPELSSYPYFNLIPYNGANLSQNQADSINDLVALGGANYSHIHFIAGDNAFIIKDTSLIAGFRHIDSTEKMLFSTPLDSIRCFFMGLLISEIPDRHCLDKHELEIINNAITNYNIYITNKANEYGFALADINSYFKRVEKGILWLGVNYNLDFVSGSFLSLDGYHPSTKGYAMIANQFIEAINTKYNASVPTTICPNCVGTQFPSE